MLRETEADFFSDPLGWIRREAEKHPASSIPETLDIEYTDGKTERIDSRRIPKEEVL